MAIDKLFPVPLTDVDINDSFWQKRGTVNREITLQIEYE